MGEGDGSHPTLATGEPMNELGYNFTAEELTNIEKGRRLREMVERTQKELGRSLTSDELNELKEKS
jgi:hypothetical protein